MRFLIKVFVVSYIFKKLSKSYLNKKPKVAL